MLIYACLAQNELIDWILAPELATYKGKAT